MEMINLLLSDKETLVRLYTGEVKNLQEKCLALADELQKAQAELSKKETILKKLEQEVSNEFSSISDRIDYKWRQEVLDYLQAIHTYSTSTSIANYVIKRDGITDVEVAKDLRNKIAITCSGLFRDKKLEREGLPGAYFYSLAVDSNPVGDEDDGSKVIGLF